jgi:glycosyltransferase involved in cell wall biosynthesis
MREFNGLSGQLYRQANDRVREEHWIWEQGPQVPELLRHLSQRGGDYDGFVFFTYLYLPTAWGLPLVAERALLVPTAHDEPALKFEAYADAFTLPRALMCNTPEERELIQARFPNHARARIVGVGVDWHRTSAARFRQKHGIERAYLLYVGRVEQGKGVPHLLRHHAAMLRRDAYAPDLVLAGDASIEVGGEGVHYLGRISEQDKFDAIAGALAVVIPSRFESLSLLALEAFAHHTPVLANGQSPVLAGQVRRSGAGFVYLDRPSFAEGVRRIAASRPELARQAASFAQKHRWPRVIEAYKQEMRRIVESAA